MRYEELFFIYSLCPMSETIAFGDLKTYFKSLREASGGVVTSYVNQTNALVGTPMEWLLLGINLPTIGAHAPKLVTRAVKLQRI
jgi:hypothetical protein